MSVRLSVQRLVLVGVLALLGILSGASVAGAQPPRVNWQRCAASWKMPKGWQCARYPVPLNYSRPQQGRVWLAVARLPASGRVRRGSVFFNPGGPGGGGLEAASLWEEYVGASVRRAYDLVTWDPRGVIHSQRALFCLSAAAARRAKSARDAVLTDREMAARLSATRQIAIGCARKRLTKFVTTMNNVRDLDRLRQAVRDQKLSYVGISYGTVIGAVYANVFPRRYRAIVLHGVVDSVTWFQPSFAFTTDDADQVQKALGAALQACDAAPRLCPLAPNALQKYSRLLTAVRARAIASQNSKDFTGLYSISRALVAGRNTTELTAELEKAYREFVRSHAATSPELAGAAQGPQPTDTWDDRTAQNSGDTRDATICSDAGRMPGNWIQAAHQADSVAPVFGAASVLDRSMCAAWTAFGDRYTGGWAAGKAPILLLNQRWDHATPLAWAQTMTRRLGRARLVTISGWGHGNQTPCGRRAVDRYLLTGKPASTTFCGDGRRLFG